MTCKNVRYCTDHGRAAATHPPGILSLHGFKSLIGGSNYGPDEIRDLLASDLAYANPAYREAAERFIAARTVVEDSSVSAVDAVEPTCRLVVIPGGKTPGMPAPRLAPVPAHTPRLTIV